MSEGENSDRALAVLLANVAFDRGAELDICFTPHGDLPPEWCGNRTERTPRLEEAGQGIVRRGEVGGVDGQQNGVEATCPVSPIRVMTAVDEGHRAAAGLTGGRDGKGERGDLDEAFDVFVDVKVDDG